MYFKSPALGRVRCGGLGGVVVSFSFPRDSRTGKAPRAGFCSRRFAPYTGPAKPEVPRWPGLAAVLASHRSPPVRASSGFPESRRESKIPEAGQLVVAHFDADGDPGRLTLTLARGLLRENAGFHALQHVEACIRQFEFARSDRERRLALVGPARYMAAHFPTRRADEQTFTTARRLFRGEAIHAE